MSRSGCPLYRLLQGAGRDVAGRIFPADELLRLKWRKKGGDYPLSAGNFLCRGKERPSFSFTSGEERRRDFGGKKYPGRGKGGFPKDTIFLGGAGKRGWKKERRKRGY